MAVSGTAVQARLCKVAGQSKHAARDKKHCRVCTDVFKYLVEDFIEGMSYIASSGSPSNESSSGSGSNESRIQAAQAPIAEFCADKPDSLEFVSHSCLYLLDYMG